jgi:hypothetical protein
MLRLTCQLVAASALACAAGCAKGSAATDVDSGVSEPADAAIDGCGSMCDADHDGVFDPDDQCAHTMMGAPVNHAGCADSQTTWMLEPAFPPYHLMWTPTGDLGKAGGLTWTYTAIERGDLFHTDWVLCDDPAQACGISLDGPIDAMGEQWTFSAADSSLGGGTLVFTNTTHILLDDMTTPALDGRLTVKITDASDMPIAFLPVTSFNLPARAGKYAAEIKGVAFKVTALAEVAPAGTTTWTPYIDYYDAAPTPMTGGSTAVSLRGDFYSK